MNAEVPGGGTPCCYVHPGQLAGGFCVSCGKPICSECTVEVDDKYQCKTCVAQKAEKTPNPVTVITRSRKNPGAAALMSFLLPGLGQLYCGNMLRGIITFVILLIGGSVVESGKSEGYIIVIPLMLIAALDAYKLAGRINSGATV